MRDGSSATRESAALRREVVVGDAEQVGCRDDPTVVGEGPSDATGESALGSIEQAALFQPPQRSRQGCALTVAWTVVGPDIGAGEVHLRVAEQIDGLFVWRAPG